MDASSSHVPATVCALIPVGPGDAELARIEDLFDSIATCEPRITSAVLVDDNLSSRHLDRRFTTSHLKVHSFVHPRRGRGTGIWGGLTEGVLTALDYIHHHTTEPFVVRLDGDSMVIAPFATRLAERFAMDLSVGVLGTVNKKPDGSPRGFHPWNNVAMHLTKKVGRCHDEETGNFFGKYLQTIYGGGRRIRRRIETALSKGYRPGEHAQGGGYAMNRPLLQAFAKNGVYQEAFDWRPLFFSEDTCVGLYARCLGFNIADFNCPGEVFGVQHWGLPGTPEYCLKAGYGVVHSLKHDPIPEQELRKQFRALRAAAKAPALAGSGR